MPITSITYYKHMNRVIRYQRANDNYAAIEWLGILLRRRRSPSHVEAMTQLFEAAHYSRDNHPDNPYAVY